MRGMASVKPKRSLEAPLGVATLVTTVAITIMTLGSELYPPLKAWLATTFGHHWVGKGVISIVLFLVVAVVSYPALTRSERSMAAWSYRLVAVVVLATVTIVAFFTYEFFFG